MDTKFVVESKTIVTPAAHQNTFTPSEEKIIGYLEELKDELFFYNVRLAGEEKLKQDISFKSIKKGIAPLRAWGKENYNILMSSYPPFHMFNERIDRAIEIDSNNDYLQRHHELEAPIKRLDDVAVIERGAWKMYVSLICRRSLEKSPDHAIFNRPIRHHICRNQYIARDSETGRFGVDERLNKELNDWDRKYKNISVPVVLAVHIMPRHCLNPVHNWITNFFHGNQSPSSSDHMNDDLWIAGKHDGWFNQRQRHLDAVWVFTGLNPWRMSMTRHQIYFNHENENQRVIREILSPYISSSIMTDEPPNELVLPLFQWVYRF